MSAGSCRVALWQTRGCQGEHSLRQDISPFPALARVRAETSSLGLSACSAGGAGHMCVWKRNPELIKRKNFFPPLALVYPCTSIGPITLSLLYKELTFSWTWPVSYEQCWTDCHPCSYILLLLKGVF